MTTVDGAMTLPDSRASIAESIAESIERRESCCVVCGATSQTIVLREGDYTGRLCSCGTIYTSPMPPEGEIDFTDDAHPEEFYSLSADFKARWLARSCPPGRLLEVGCGNGSFLAAARQRGFDVHGLEPHPGRAANAARRHGLQVRREFLEETTWPHASFDVVYHCDLLSHFPDPIQSLQTMIGLLRPNGRLCFEVGLIGGLSPLWYWLTRRIGLEHHLWLYSRPSLRQLLTAAGLEVVEIQSFGLIPYVGFGRTAAFATKLISGGLNGTQTAIGRRFADRVEAGLHQFRYWLRYPIGAWIPKVGPQTVLVVARPVGE
jgi:SAM-dependent methyltransferase